MKTSFFLLLSFVLLLSSCAKETDIIAPVTALSNSDEYLRSRPDAARQTHFTEVTATHWLDGTCTDQPVREMALESTIQFPSKRYVIQASGDAVSKTYDRGRSELELVFHTQTRRLTGFLKTNFYYGESMEILVDDIANVRFDGQDMQWNVRVRESTLHLKGETVSFNQGEIIIKLPANPEGPLYIEMISDVSL
jgi:hypothetical protein